MRSSCLLAVTTLLAGLVAPAAPGSVCTMVASLDGEWLLACDPGNVGREQEWWRGPPTEARVTRVPWIIQGTFPGYHGVAWYYRDCRPPERLQPGGRYLLRLRAVDYLADVWVNDTPVGSHEGAEDPFVLDVTDALRPGSDNRIVVRVLNPTYEPIDGIALAQTPHRNKTYPYTPGSDFNYGGITDSVELLAAPAVRVEDLFARPDPQTGRIRAQVNLRNAAPTGTPGVLTLTVAPAAGGETLDVGQVERELPPGDTLVEAELTVPTAHRWDLNDPYLYRVTARVEAERAEAYDEQSTRCGFRDFRFERGYFRLNGRRLFLRSSHTGADTPIGVRVPYDPDLLRRDLLNVKVMGFNMLRFIAGVPRRPQLDLADEIGLLVYEESFASWGLGESPQMAERFDHSTAGMVRRDRNHPSVVIWGLLNETAPNSVFYHAVGALPLVRSLDDSRVVMLNSGRFDGFTQANVTRGPADWRVEGNIVPNVTHNGTDAPVPVADSTWAPGQFALHPGLGGEYAVVRWTAPAAGDYALAAQFAGLARKPTTSDLHILHNGTELFEGFLNVRGHGNAAEYATTVAARAGDTLDVVVGTGGDSPFSDTTALALTIAPRGGTPFDVAADFSIERNPNGAWTYGYLPPGARPDSAQFRPYPQADSEAGNVIGSLANPGSREWEDVLSDQHPYQRVPHTAPIMHTLRSLSGDGRPVFVSEYGVGSAIDLVRVTRHYEQLGQEQVEDAQVYRRYLDLFLADWERWRMGEVFASPEDYFRQCLAKMAGQRLLGITALRSNPNVVGYSLTGTQDQGLTAEGLTTTFRELKPGTVDALFEAFAPLKWCLFAEPANVYRGGRVRLEAMLANEDALRPGEYPARLQVVGAGGERVLDRTVTVTIPAPQGEQEPPFALPVFAEEVTVDGPAGRYRFLAALEKGGAPTGGEADFTVADPAEMPPIETEVMLWGEDAELAGWLNDHGIQARPVAAETPAAREVILVGAAPAQGETAAWQELAQRMARGATVVFLCPEVFRRGDDPVGWVPLAQKGALARLASWVYLKDEWAKRHPVFDGLPAGGLMDYTVYREVIPDLVWSGQEAPAEAAAGANNTSLGYASGLLVAVYEFGAGRFVLNTLRLRENMASDPVAERLLRNLLRYAARERGQAVAELPADFGAQLTAIGYE